MQDNPHYSDLMREIISYLEEGMEIAKKAGIEKERIVVDPGIGFGKRFEDNYTLLRRLSELRSLGRPILVGASRKSFIGHALNLPPEERLEGSLACATIALLHGASIIRTHDVKETRRAVKMVDIILGRC